MTELKSSREMKSCISFPQRYLSDLTMPVSFIHCIFFPHSGVELALIVKWIIVNSTMMFPAHSVTSCQANKSLAFGFTIFICSIFHPWAKY